MKGIKFVKQYHSDEWKQNMEITLAETNKTKYGYIGIVQVTISIYFNIYLCSA